MNEIELDPDGPAVKRLIKRAVDQNLADSPVRYAFEEDWPVELSALEGQELMGAVRLYQPLPTNMHGEEHKKRAIRVIREKIHKKE